MIIMSESEPESLRSEITAGEAGSWSRGMRSVWVGFEVGRVWGGVYLLYFDTGSWRKKMRS